MMNKDVEAFETMINTLEKQVSCNDCISRQAVLDTLNNHTYSEEFCLEHHIDWSINLGIAHIVINELPSVTPQQNTGHWIKFTVNRQHKIKCSKCDYTECEYITHIRNFCPNCGAKMESEG